jgi:hypothetical protein
MLSWLSNIAEHSGIYLKFLCWNVELAGQTSSAFQNTMYSVQRLCLNARLDSRKAFLDTVYNVSTEISSLQSNLAEHY